MGYVSGNSFQQFTTPVLPGKSHLLYGDHHNARYPILKRLLETKTNTTEGGGIPTRFVLKSEKDLNPNEPHQPPPTTKKAKRSSDIESVLFTEILTDENQRNLLYQVCEASRYGDLDSLKLAWGELEGEGAVDINTLPFPLNNTPLHIASSEGHLAVVEYLVEALKMATDLPDVNLETPLLKSCKQGHLEVCEFLLENGALSSHVDSQGWTALHNASCFGHLELVKFLVEKGQVNVNPQSARGFTPLMDAAAKGYTDVVKYLLFQPYSLCDPTIQNQLGETAYAIAAIYEHVEICDALLLAESSLTKTVSSSQDFRTDQVAFLVSVYENQRCPPPSMFKSFLGNATPTFSPLHLTPRDQRAPFTYLGSHQATELTLVPLPTTDPSGHPCTWSWQTEWWLHTQNPLLDDQTGWQYAPSFDTPELNWSPHFPRSPHNWVRRRRWVRVVKKPLDLVS